MKTSGIKKRSIRIAGHNTSVSIEDEFWDSLREIARQRGTTLPRLIDDIDMEKKSENLASALRIFVLRYYRDQVDNKGQVVVPRSTYPEP